MILRHAIYSAIAMLFTGKRSVGGSRVWGTEEVISAARSPWPHPYIERVIGSIRRDCLDHLIILNERHLRGILREYIEYHHTCRTHLSLNKDPPENRIVEPPKLGNIVAFPRIGGLHRRYSIIAA